MIDDSLVSTRESKQHQFYTSLLPSIVCEILLALSNAVTSCMAIVGDMLEEDYSLHGKKGSRPFMAKLMASVLTRGEESCR